MRNKILPIMFSCAVLLCLSVRAQTVDEVVSKHLKARGGVEKIKAIKTIKVTAKVTMQGIEAPAVLQLKRPNLYRLDITIQGKPFVQAYDGTTAWTIVPFKGSLEPEKMSEQEASNIKEESDLEGALVNYKEKGHTVELVGKEDMGGTAVYKLKLTTKNGSVHHIYLDAQNFMQLRDSSKRKIQGVELETDTYFSDYKPVNGLMIPYALETKIGGKPFNQFKIDKVELDTDISDSVFKMPAKSPDTQPTKP